jgi:hypothetical protein
VQILFEEGRRYPAARVTGSRQILVVAGEDHGVAADPRLFCDYELGTRSAAWGSTASAGVWRTFSELDLDDSDQVTVFLRRWGDPTDDVPREPGYLRSTASWSNLQIILRTAASSWDPLQADGTRAFSSQRAREVGVQWASYSPTLLDNLAAAVLPDGTLGFRARNLRGYMVGTALLAVQESSLMRRCNHCSGWYVVRRRGGLYCSATCRATAHAAAAAAGPAPQERARHLLARIDQEHHDAARERLLGPALLSEYRAVLEAIAAGDVKLFAELPRLEKIVAEEVDLLDLRRDARGLAASRPKPQRRRGKSPTRPAPAAKKSLEPANHSRSRG